MKVIVIRTDGTEETHNVRFDQVAALIGARDLDTVNLFRNPENVKSFGMRRPIMAVDDGGYEIEEVNHGPGPAFVAGRMVEAGFRLERKPVRALKPVNERATFLYHSVCIPGTTHKIVGDVAILDDEDVD